MKVLSAWGKPVKQGRCKMQGMEGIGRARPAVNSYPLRCAFDGCWGQV